MFDALAERRIVEAQARGEFDALPGAGRPLALDEDLLVPEEERVACRILRNAGFIPPEVETRREISSLTSEARESADAATRLRAMRKLQALTLALSESRAGRFRGLLAEPRYYARIVSRLG
jgi:hypothetical protein